MEQMKKVLLSVAAGCVLTCSFAAAQQERGYWRAVSTTAKGVTGDVSLTELKVTINLNSFTIAQIRDLKVEEASAAFGENGAGGSGSLYRLSIPADRKFLHKNTLCGSDETQWMVTYAAGRSLQIAFFSGESMPVFTPEAMANATNLCGTYSYTR